MNENVELLEYIYKNSEMGKFTLEKLLKSLETKENKIKKTVEEQLKGYEKYYKESSKRLKKKDADHKTNGMMAKMGASMGIMKEVKSDNSDASIAHMLVEGITMGVVDMTTKIKNFEEYADKDTISLAKDFLKFQEEQIELLKEYM